jgi:group I intron endonuclease
MYYLYQITNLLNGKRYIGITNRPIHRWKQHCRSSRKTAISTALKKYGPQNFEFKVLVIGAEEYIKCLEVKAIVLLNTKAPSGYNLTDGGEGTTGWKSTVISRKKCSDAQRLRFLNPKEREKIRQSHTGLVRPYECKEKHRQLMLTRYKNPIEREKTRQQSLGRKHSEVAKLKCRLANPKGSDSRNAKQVLVHGIKYGCMKDAAKVLDINYTTLNERFRKGNHPELYRYL